MGAVIVTCPECLPPPDTDLHLLARRADLADMADMATVGSLILEGLKG